MLAASFRLTETPLLIPNTRIVGACRKRISNKQILQGEIAKEIVGSAGIEAGGVRPSKRSLYFKQQEIRRTTPTDIDRTVRYYPKRHQRPSSQAAETNQTTIVMPAS